MDMDLSKLQETVENRGAWHATVYEAAKRWTWLSDWTTTIYMYMCIWMHACSLICDSLRLMNCSWSGSSVHEILQARLLEWVAKSSSRQSTWSRDWTHVSYVAILAGGSLPPSQPGKPIYVCIYMCVCIYIYIYVCVYIYGVNGCYMLLDSNNWNTLVQQKFLNVEFCMAPLTINTSDLFWNLHWKNISWIKASSP